MRAYDIAMLKRPVNRADPEDRGWVFGRPPGIKPEQWPLDPNNGFPLMHGFTIELPEDYRCHGPEIVALSFFATPPDHNDGSPLIFPDVAAASVHEAVRPADPILRRSGTTADREPSTRVCIAWSTYLVAITPPSC